MRTNALRLLAAGIVATAASLASAETPPPADTAGPPRTLRDRFWFGGAFGLSFGDVDYYEVTPIVGFHVTPKISVGTSVSWIRREYSDPIDDSTNDLGFHAFGRYRVLSNIFAELQYSYIDYEIPLVGGGTIDDTYSTMLAGGGWVQPMGSNASFIVSVLYDFGYSEDDPAPYDDRWVVSAGFGFGF